MDGRNNFQEEKTWQEAPVGTTGNVMLELPILKRYYEHPYLKVNTRKRGTDDETNSEGSTYSSVTSPLKNRKQQRAENEKGHKRNKPEQPPANQFDVQAAAANRQIATEENRNMIDFLRLMQESNVYTSEEMKTKFIRAEKKILGDDVNGDVSSPVDLQNDDKDDASAIGIDSDGEETNLV